MGRQHIVGDLVDHFISRGHQGKAMVISIDKATAVKMHDKVKANWQRTIDNVRVSIATTTDETRQALVRKLDELVRTDMAVVVSASQNEIPDLAAKGVDIAPHRKRMVREHLDVKFKDPDDPLRFVFVCAMWLTGFDAPATSTIYLDKPMRNHTLMQTIARANRVFQGKQAGEIIDYIGVFRNLQEALAVYGTGSGGGIADGDMPVASKEVQAEQLAEVLLELSQYAGGNGVSLSDGIGVAAFDWVAWLAAATEKILVSDDVRRGFLTRADMCATQWKAVKPHPAATESQPIMSVIVTLAQRVRMETGQPDISGVMADVERLLQESVGAVPFVIAGWKVVQIDLTRIDFDALAALFAAGNTATAAARLQASLEQRLDRMVRLNAGRVNYADKLREMIDRYNQGSKNIEEFFDELKKLAASLTEEEERHVREELTEEELAVFDLLTQPDPVLTKMQETSVKNVVRELLDKLKRELLVLDWKQRQTTRAAVQVTIEQLLDGGLPAVYDRTLFARKSAAVFEHVFAKYQGNGHSVYTDAA